MKCLTGAVNMPKSTCDRLLPTLFLLGSALVSTVLSSGLIYSSQSGVGLGRCNPGNFECPNSMCINASSQCDGINDCTDGYDELFCPIVMNCRLDEYRCPNEDKCIPLYTRCDGIADCTNGTDETCPLSPDSLPCGYTHFSCNNQCMQYAYLCDGVQHCSMGEDESGCNTPIVKYMTRSVSVVSGDTVTLTCIGNSYPPPFVSWKRNLEPLRSNPRYNLLSGSGVGTLTIQNAQIGDAGKYSCELQSRLHGTVLSLESTTVNVVDENPFVCTDYLNQDYQQGEYYYSTRFFTSGPASEAAADIIFVVDESGSMAMEHAWIQSEVYLLDQALRRKGVGTGLRRNMFALVGFGRNDFNLIGGITLSELALPDDFVVAAGNLQLTGILEDGYAAIDYALNSIQTRSGTAKQLILITDEDRGILRADLSRDIIEKRITESDFMLNTIINQGFLSNPNDGSSFALGLGANGTAFVLNSSSPSLFSPSEDGAPNHSPFFGFGESFEQYASLAHSTGGAAWDLNQLREQGVVAEAFTNAFTAIKVEEVMSVLRRCFLCLCQFPDEYCAASNRSIDQCIGTAQVVSIQVVPSRTLAPIGSQVNFECIINANLPRVFSTTWDYPSGADVTTQNNSLSITEVTTQSEGIYTCRVNIDTPEGQLQFSGDATLQIDTRCKLDDGTYILAGHTRQIQSPRKTNRTRAVDIILLVDESGSMSMEHAWIPAMIEQLDSNLQTIGIGVSPRNFFGVVGFGDDCNNELGQARVLTTSTEQPFVTADNISHFTMNLSVGGRREDGYSAIQTAIESYQFRDGAKLFILITDEDRDVLNANLTRTNTVESLQNEGVVLNAIISEEYQFGEGFRSLGVDSKNNTFIYDPTARSLFRAVFNNGSPIPDSAHGTTNADYTQLALELEGAAWDISQLRQGGSVADAFTRAFVSVKVLEARRQMEECLECECTIEGTSCQALVPQNLSCPQIEVPVLPGETQLSVQLQYSSTRISPSQDLALHCTINCSASLGWTFNGADLPSNTIVSDITSSMTSLTIIDGNKENAGVYACLAHSASERYSNSAAARIEFYDPTEDLMLQLTPLEASFPRGGDNELTCSVEAPAFIKWSFNDGPLPPNVLVTSSEMLSTLTVIATNDSNSGAYTCTANSTDQGVLNRDTAYIEVVDPGIRVTVEQNLFNVTLNASVELICAYTSDFASANVIWRRLADKPLPTQAEVHQTLAGVSLLIPSISYDDGGRYICTGRAGDQTTESAAYIVIQVPEPEFEVTLSPSESSTIAAGSNQSVICDANQDTSSFKWLFNGLEVQMQGEPPLTGNVAPLNIVVVAVSERRSILTILAATDANTGEYQCLAISTVGDSVIANIEVLIQT